MVAVGRTCGLAGALAALVAGCGSGGGDGGTTTHAAHHSRPPCPAAIAGDARTRVVSAEPMLRTCAYAAGTDSFRVTLDDLPQAWFRYDRAQIERWQNTEGWAHHPAQEPRLVHGVGAGAFWVQATRELVASDGRRIVTVRVLKPAGPGARSLALRAARPVLGPSRVPVKTGP